MLLLVNTALLTVLTCFSVTTVHTIDREIAHHRLRNEAENLCQLEALAEYGNRLSVAELLAKYKKCVTEKSGQNSPLGNASHR